MVRLHDEEQHHPGKANNDESKPQRRGERVGGWVKQKPGRQTNQREERRRTDVFVSGEYVSFHGGLLCCATVVVPLLPPLLLTG